jgi:ketosteroid isomerase-like protein
MDTAEAIAREQIRDVIARYNHAGDRGRLDELVLCFTEDGVMQLPDVPELRGRGAIRGYLEGVVRDLAAATTRATLRHHVASTLIELTGTDTASASSYFSVFTEVGLDHWGSYRDRLARVGEGWLLAQRRVRVDGATPSSRMAVGHRVAGTTP